LIKFIPTLTQLLWNFSAIDFCKYDEVLLTPNERFKGIDNKLYDNDIIIDNGGFSINGGFRPKEQALRHIEICEQLPYDPRYIFILPDVLADLDFSLETTKKFLDLIKPKRLVIPYINPEYVEQVESLIDIEPEFYGVVPKRAHTILIDPSKVHLFGRVNPTQFEGFRSYDSFVSYVKAE
jgi:hypothetical protein